jgi:uncharacterized Tic20 family protein
MTTEPTQQPDDDQRVSRLSTPPQDDDATVREYQARYRPFDFDDADAEPVPIMNDAPPKRKFSDGRSFSPRSYSTLRVTDEERLWAAGAHASAWVTFVAGVFTFGTIIPLSIFIPLGIYFLFRRKSDYVAFHALQAFVLQLIGTVGALVLLIAGGLVWGIGMVIALMAVVLIVGFILVPVWGLVGVALLLLFFALPIAMLLFGTIAAIQTYQGRDYQYPFVARWVDRQLAGGFLNTV